MAALASKISADGTYLIFVAAATISQHQLPAVPKLNFCLVKLGMGMLLHIIDELKRASPSSQDEKQLIDSQYGACKPNEPLNTLPTLSISDN